MFNLFSPVIVGVAGAVLALILIVVFIIKRYRIARPDEALILTGKRSKPSTHGGITVDQTSGQKIVIGAGVFVWPFIQKFFPLSLSARKIVISTVAQDARGITISARAVAMIKVGSSVEMVRLAAQRFLNQQAEIETFAEDVLSGSLRGIIGSLTVEQIISDRQSVASQVLGAAEEALSKQGLIIDTLQIQEITDNQGYIENIGKPEAARIRQNAEVADVEAHRAAAQAKIDADKQILENERELKLFTASVQKETDKAAAEAAAAKPLEDATQRQMIIEREQAVAVKQVELKEQQLNAEVRKVADAEAYEVRIRAEAEASAQVARAEAQKAQAVLLAEAEKERRTLAADALRQEANAEAESIRVRGEAEALATTATGEAEGVAIAARAKALAEESEAVLAQQLIQLLPEIVGRMADAYGANPNITLIGGDGNGGGGSLAPQLAGNITTVTQILKDTVGVDLPSLITGRQTGMAIGEGLAGKTQGE